MNPRRLTEDSPVLAFIVGDTFTATGLVLCRVPPKSSAQIVAGVLTFDSPGLYRFARRGENSYVEAIAFDPLALGQTHSHASNVNAPGQRDPRGALRALVADGRCTEAVLLASIEADDPAPVIASSNGVQVDGPRKVPPHGRPGSVLPFEWA